MIAHISIIYTISSLYCSIFGTDWWDDISAIGNDSLRFNVIVYLTLQNAVELGHMGKGRTNASRLLYSF